MHISLGRRGAQRRRNPRYRGFTNFHPTGVAQHVSGGQERRRFLHHPCRAVERTSGSPGLRRCAPRPGLICATPLGWRRLMYVRLGKDVRSRLAECAYVLAKMCSRVGRKIWRAEKRRPMNSIPPTPSSPAARQQKNSPPQSPSKHPRDHRPHPSNTHLLPLKSEKGGQMLCNQCTKR